MKERRKNSAAVTLTALLRCISIAAASVLIPKKDERPSQDAAEECGVSGPEEKQEKPEEHIDPGKKEEETAEGGETHNDGVSPPDPGLGGGDYGGGNGSWSDPPVSGGDTEPLYDYFEERGWLICRGCYRPFADVRALNAHECSYHESSGCEHEWVAEYNDIWIEPKVHYEYGIVQEAFDEPVYGEM